MRLVAILPRVLEPRIFFTIQDKTFNLSTTMNTSMPASKKVEELRKAEDDEEPDDW